MYVIKHVKIDKSCISSYCQVTEMLFNKDKAHARSKHDYVFSTDIMELHMYIDGLLYCPIHTYHTEKKEKKIDIGNQYLIWVPFTFFFNEYICTITMILCKMRADK